MTAWRRLLGALLGGVVGYSITVLPCIWEGYRVTHRTDHDIVLHWITLYSPAGVVPLLVGAFVGQSILRKAPRS